LDDAKKRVRKLKKTRKGPKLSSSTGRRGRKVALVLVPLAVIGGFVASRLLRGKDDQEVNDSAVKVAGQQDKTTD
jgi:hypothetical protein